MKSRNRNIIIAAAICAALACAAPAPAQEAAQGTSCPHVIINAYDTACIDGYQWLIRYETAGCYTYAVPIAQKFGVVTRKNGTPKLTVPIACEGLDPIPVQ